VRGRLFSQRQLEEKAMNKNTICLWYDHDAEAAANFYAATFPDSAVGAVFRAPGDYPRWQAG
jgi:predicted 3-demethylubiquinone-9 3-methyltransferase (glyoxalase superfamily)